MVESMFKIYGCINAMTISNDQQANATARTDMLNKVNTLKEDNSSVCGYGQADM